MVRIHLQKIKKTLKVGFAMAKANFTLRNEGSYLGIVWYLLNPLAMFLIIILIKKHAISGNIIDHYEIYLLIGIIGFNFFKQSLSNSINAISSNVNYLKSINNIPAEALVISGLVEAIFSHFFDLILIIGFMLIYRIPLMGLVFYPIIFLFFVILLLGLSFIFATLGMYIKDFGNVWSIITQLLFFVTPIFYSITEKNSLYLINLFNPLFYFLSIIRSSIIYLKMPSLWMTFTFGITCFASLFIGCAIFNKYKKSFPER